MFKAPNIANSKQSQKYINSINKFTIIERKKVQESE